MQAGDLKQTHGRLWSVNVHLRREMSIAASACQKSTASAESFHSSNWLFTRRFQSWSKKKNDLLFYRIKPGVDASGMDNSSVTSYSVLKLNHKFSRHIYKPPWFHKSGSIRYGVYGDIFFTAMFCFIQYFMYGRKHDEVAQHLIITH